MKKQKIMKKILNNFKKYFVNVIRNTLVRGDRFNEMRNFFFFFL